MRIPMLVELAIHCQTLYVVSEISDPLMLYQSEPSKTTKCCFGHSSHAPLPTGPMKNTFPIQTLSERCRTCNRQTIRCTGHTWRGLEGAARPRQHFCCAAAAAAAAAAATVAFFVLPLGTHICFWLTTTVMRLPYGRIGAFSFWFFITRFFRASPVIQSRCD